MTDRVKPEDCATMAELRHGIDALDEAIIAAIGERFRYIEAAARIKDRRIFGSRHFSCSRNR